MPQPDVPPGRLGGLRRSTDRIAFIDDDGQEIRVRWQLGRDEIWRCDACGSMQSADCAHTFAAGLLLAEELLGLSRIPELRPTTGTPQ